MTHDDRPVLTLYSTADCSLCADARETLQALLEERARAGLALPAVRDVDIASDPALGRHRSNVPVLELRGEELPLATSVGRMRAFLSRTLDANLA